MQVRSILSRGLATRAVLGIAVLAGAQLRALGIEGGVLVLTVPPNSEAALGGLRGSVRDASGAVDIGDVIVECDGAAINSETDLFRALDSHQPGDVVKVVVLRGLQNILPESATGLAAPRPSGPADAKPPAIERKELRVKLSAVDIPVPLAGTVGNPAASLGLP